MKKARFSRWYLLLGLPVLVALVGLVWGRPSVEPQFGKKILSGRYVSAENVYDVSSVHDAGGAGNVGSPLFAAATAVLIADGDHYVCGASDGFYGGYPIPGGNYSQDFNGTTPVYFNGTYTVDGGGRVTMNVCKAAAWCNHTTCDTSGATVYRTWVGYIQSYNGFVFTSIDQINSSDKSLGGCCASTGYLVHARVWQRDPWAK